MDGEWYWWCRSNRRNRVHWSHRLHRIHWSVILKVYLATFPQEGGENKPLNKNAMSDILPPDKVFLNPRVHDLGQLRKWETFYTFKEFSFPSQGGYLAHYHDKAHPLKGFPYTSILEANNTAKRLTIGLVMMLKPTWHPIENALFQYQRLADYLYTPHYLHERYYNDCSREVFGFVFRFLRKLSFDFQLSYGIGRIVATLLEYEHVYRFRWEDIFSETTKEKLLANPRKELKRLEQVYLSRENYVGENAVSGRVKMTFMLLRFLLLVPSIRKAFKFSLRESEFKNFQFDEIEKYWADRFSGYDYGGEPYQIRQLKQGFNLYGI